MSDKLFEHLQQLDLIRNGRVNRHALSRASSTKLLDAVHKALELTRSDTLSREKSIFAHSASLSLGGARSPCAGFKCRASRAYQMAQFAAMYSDRVYVSNFLADHVEHDGAFTGNTLKERLEDDLKLLLLLKPLLESRRVVLFSPQQHYCAHCLARLNFGADAEQRFDKEMDRLTKHVGERIEATVRWEEETGEFLVDIVGPEELIEHGERTVTARNSIVKSAESLFESVKEVGERKLTKQEIHRLTLSRYLANEEFASIKFELGCSLSLGTAFLTDRSIHLDVLSKLSEDPGLEQRNHAALKHLTSMVPFLEGATIPQVLALRNQQEEAFILYRQAINRAIAEYQNEKSVLTERAARTIYSDVIEPELARLSLKVKEAKRSMKTSLRQRIFAWTGAISFGSYTGLVQGGLLATAKAFGLTKAVSDLLELTMQKSDYEAGIRSEEMYFLWKVRQQSK